MLEFPKIHDQTNSNGIAYVPALYLSCKALFETLALFEISNGQRTPRKRLKCFRCKHSISLVTCSHTHRVPALKKRTNKIKALYSLIRDFRLLHRLHTLSSDLNCAVASAIRLITSSFSTTKDSKTFEDGCLTIPCISIRSQANLL